MFSYSHLHSQNCPKIGKFNVMLEMTLLLFTIQSGLGHFLKLLNNSHISETKNSQNIEKFKVTQRIWKLLDYSILLNFD